MWVTSPRGIQQTHLNILGGHLTKGGLRTINSFRLLPCRHLAITDTSEQNWCQIPPQPPPPPPTKTLPTKKFQLLQTFTYENNKYTPTQAFSLACLEIRLRNEEAINSTRNRIYSLKVLYLPPTLAKSSILLFICIWIDLVCVLAMTGNTCAVPGYMSV